MLAPGKSEAIRDSVGNEKGTAWTGLFAGKPAPTSTAHVSKTVRPLWERACPRRGQRGLSCRTRGLAPTSAR
ncbi:hypothetical protein DM807_16295 [Pseudomonas hunanensis]|nr:hypothetical protein [Pseudomonas hunanensis]RNF69745.1 hypothetical protein EFJ98_15800 [Pseudomonas putida]